MMMMQPSKFDENYAKSMEKCTGEEALQMIAKDKDVLKQVNAAIAAHDANKATGKPSRTQAIRTALKEALEAV